MYYYDNSADIFYLSKVSLVFFIIGISLNVVDIGLKVRLTFLILLQLLPFLDGVILGHVDLKQLFCQGDIFGLRKDTLGGMRAGVGNFAAVATLSLSVAHTNASPAVGAADLCDEVVFVDATTIVAKVGYLTGV